MKYSRSSFGESEMATTSMLKHFGATEFSALFDYVMVFKMEEGTENPEQSVAAKTCISAMLNAGLEVFPYLSVQKDELYALIRAPLEKLKEFADIEDYLMHADELYLENLLKAGDSEAKIAPIEIKDDRNITPYSPYSHIFLEFRSKLDTGLYKIPTGDDTPFIKSVRLKLIMAILKAPRRNGGCDLEISKLLYRGHILALYPLHDRSITSQLATKCASVCAMPWDTPMHDLKEYFGEKIALYTVFIGHYSMYLIIPSLVGLIFQLVVWGTGNFSHPVLPFYSLLITVWSILMLEYWKRQEATTAMHWGMTNFEKQEQGRPEFKGELTKSHINGEEIVYFPEKKLERLQFFSRSVVSTFIMIVVGVVAAIYVLRFSLQQKSETNPYASLVASVLNAVQIQVFNMLYQKIVILLTNNENHRTDTLYEDSMIIKLFAFQFINSYSSFFFLGFIATYLPKPDGATSEMVGQCAATNCMEPIAINLAIIFGTRLFLTNFLDVFLPYLSYRGKLKAETKGVDLTQVKLTPAEKDYLLVKYETMVESIGCYADTAIQYGYTMLFITALPIASFCSLVNNWARIKFYTYKLFHFYQRPVPTGAQDIGTWMPIFQFLSFAAVITNGALICFTMDVLWDRFSLAGRLWIFIGFQWVLMSIQFMAQEVIDDVPLEVQIQTERNEFINLKVVEKVADEDFGIVFAEDDDEEGEEKAKRGPVHCGNLCGIRFKEARPQARTVKSRKMRADLPAYTEFAYPEAATASGAWPKPLSKKTGNVGGSIRELKEQAKAARDASYISNAPAVAAAPASQYSAMPHPPAPGSPGPGGYAAVPPPAPGYV